MKVSKLMELLAKCNQEASVVLVESASDNDGDSADYVVYHPATGNVVIADKS